MDILCTWCLIILNFLFISWLESFQATGRTSRIKTAAVDLASLRSKNIPLIYCSNKCTIMPLLEQYISDTKNVWCQTLQEYPYSGRGTKNVQDITECMTLFVSVVV